MNQSSRLWWNGTPGTSGPASRVTGPSRCSKPFSPISAAISAPNPPNRFASWTTSAFPVFPGEGLSRLERDVAHEPVAEDRQVAALARHGRLADGQNGVSVGHLGLEEAV